MAKWIVRVPFEGVGYIPLETDAEPGTPEFKELVDNRIQIGSVHSNKPSVFKREQMQADPADENEYSKLERSIRDTNRREGVKVTKLSSKLDAIADSLEARGYVKEAAEIDAISNTLELTATEQGGEALPKIEALVGKEDQKVVDSLKILAKRLSGASIKLMDELLDHLSRDTMFKTADGKEGAND